MDKPRWYYVKLNRKRQTPYDFSYMCNLRNKPTKQN